MVSTDGRGVNGSERLGVTSLPRRRGGPCKLTRGRRGWACLVRLGVGRVVGLRFSGFGSRVGGIPSLGGEREGEDDREFEGLLGFVRLCPSLRGTRTRGRRFVGRKRLRGWWMVGMG